MKTTFISILWAALLLPYLLLCGFAFPFADDFCFAWTSASSGTFLYHWLDQYLHWNGRYTADALANLHPLLTGDFKLYQTISYLSVLLITPLYYRLLQRILHNKTNAAIGSAVCGIYFLSYMPQLAEGIYWYIGICNYLLGNFLLLIHFILVFRKSTITNVFATITLVMAIGCNEVAALTIPALYLLILFIAKREFPAYQKQARNMLLLAVIASAFVILSPGNFTRSGQFTESFQWSHSLLYAGLQTARFLGTWMLSPAFWLISILTLAYTPSILPDWAQRVGLLPWFYFLLLLFTAAFLPYIGTGILGQHRTINYAFFFFLPLWLWGLLNVGHTAHTWLAPLTKPIVAMSVCVLIFLCFVFTGNTYTIITDIRLHKLTAYKNEYLQRDKDIQLKGSTAIQPLNAIPQSLTITDAKGDADYWVDKCMGYYYSAKSKQQH